MSWMLPMMFSSVLQASEPHPCRFKVLKRRQMNFFSLLTQLLPPAPSSTPSSSTINSLQLQRCVVGTTSITQTTKSNKATTPPYPIKIIGLLLSPHQPCDEWIHHETRRRLSSLIRRQWETMHLGTRSPSSPFTRAMATQHQCWRYHYNYRQLSEDQAYSDLNTAAWPIWIVSAGEWVLRLSVEICSVVERRGE